MTALPVAHIGILVADLETSRHRWSTVLGQPFSPITRYRSTTWSDRGDPRPHLHDARLSFYLGDHPSVELLEFVGTGTHAPSKGEGGHHLSFPPIADNSRRRSELAEMGVGIDGEIFHDGRWIFQFTEAEALNNVYTEWVEEHPDHPDVKDDLSPVNRLPDGTKTLFDVDTILGLPDGRPSSRIAEIGVAVAEVSAALDRWQAIIGYDLEILGPDCAISRERKPRIRLEQGVAGGHEGLRYAVVVEPDLEGTLARLQQATVPLAASRRSAVGVLQRVEVSPAYLNNFGIIFVASD
ncbi:MAG: VOC family protein [Propioniciclava sp.]